MRLMTLTLVQVLSKNWLTPLLVEFKHPGLGSHLRRAFIELCFGGNHIPQ